MSLGSEIFVIHGRDKRARREIFTFLRSLALRPIEWTEALAHAGGGAPTIGDVLDKAIRPDRAFLVLLTPDDIAHLKPEHADGEDDQELVPSGQARPNVLFEAGMALGRHPEHTVVVQFGKVRPFTDIAGRFVVRLDNSPESRRKLAHRLQAIGAAVNLDGTDWLSAGDLTPPTSLPQAHLPAGAGNTTHRPSPKNPTGIEFTHSVGTNKIVMSNFSIIPRRGRVVIHGEVANNEAYSLMLAIKATCYDTTGLIVGSGNSIVSGIGPGDHHTFDATIYDDVKDLSRVHLQVSSAVPG